MNRIYHIIVYFFIFLITGCFQTSGPKGCKEITQSYNFKGKVIKKFKTERHGRFIEIEGNLKGEKKQLFNLYDHCEPLFEYLRKGDFITKNRGEMKYFVKRDIDEEKIFHANCE